MNFDRIEKLLGYQFQNPDLLKQALTHRSHGNKHNERLEFLGDGVLNCIIAAELYDRFPELKEGDLSRFRANLVRQESLHQMAQMLMLGDLLLLGDGEHKSGGNSRPSILADTLEALIGAIFVDGGFNAAKASVTRLFQPILTSLDSTSSLKDAKTLLQELMQARHLPLPQYVVISTEGAAHEQRFEVECRIDSLSVQTVGIGASRRAAEQVAAMQAIRRIRK